MADLKALAPRQSSRLQLVHPLAGPLDAWVTLAGPSHPASILARRDAETAFLNAKKEEVEASEFRNAIAVKLAVARTLGWEGITENGAELPFSAEAAARIYSDPDNDWLTKAIDNALSAKTFFFQS